ncbi:MAG: thrombospondin type 3 repeat-containing protein, partial [Bacteroidetes bacterium]|nr:thrombospondin type 3 repeat-containing protein [Bacteroidota bacterium]
MKTALFYLTCFLLLLSSNNKFMGQTASKNITLSPAKKIPTIYNIEEIKEYEVFVIDNKNYFQSIEKEFSGNLIIDLGDSLPKLYHIYPTEVFSKEPTVKFKHLNTIKEVKIEIPKTFRGYATNNTLISITLNHNYFYAQIKVGNDTYVLENLSKYNKNVSFDYLIFYNTKYSGNNIEVSCVSDNLKIDEGKDEADNFVLKTSGCKEVALAIATDSLFYLEHIGSPPNINNITTYLGNIINLVNGDYDNVFSNKLSYYINETFIEDASTKSVFNSSTDVLVLLGAPTGPDPKSFRVWAAANFDPAHNAGMLFTGRNVNYQGSTSIIGLSYTGAVCINNYKYLVVEDVLTTITAATNEDMRHNCSHELGHLFNASHDTQGGFIMSPLFTIGSSSYTWSSTSINTINTKVSSITCLATCPTVDTDSDGFEDYTDNCPLIYNPSQADLDGDGLGNPCDNCPGAYNPGQDDDDNDGYGNLCDLCNDFYDQDNDNVSDDCDNCIAIANTDQADTDADGIGNVCDNCPSTANNNQADTDSDSIGDACDNCPSLANTNQADSDSDGIGNVCDNCPSTANTNQADSDSDGIGNVCDNCPLV